MTHTGYCLKTFQYETEWDSYNKVQIAGLSYNNKVQVAGITLWKILNEPEW